MRHGLLVPLGNVVASERDTRRVEMVKTLINSFVPPHDTGHLAQEQVTAIGIDLLKGATEFEAIAHLGCDVRAKEQSEGLTWQRTAGAETRADWQSPRH